LISSVFELGIEAKFWSEAKPATTTASDAEPEFESVGMEEATEAWAWV
jgi:hypothetical protein